MASSVQLTHGFLFADLRGYTAFVESRGDAAGARLLRVYRDFVRSVIERFDGAEIRTEGDSFYIVFPSASAAVAAGLAIVQAAEGATADDPELPMRVGIGIHAGESEATDEGYVGSAVNVAARLCALAAPGEVLVSDTVRGLTRTQGSVTYEPRGSRRLKGIAESVTIYRAIPRDAAHPVAGPTRFRGPISRVGRRGTVGLAIGTVVVLAAFAVVAASVLPGAAPSSSPTQRPTTAPTPTAIATIAVRDLPFGPIADPGPIAPGRYRFPQFYRQPVVDLAAGWSVQPITSDQGHQRLKLTDRPSSLLVLMLMKERPTDVCAADPLADVADTAAYLDWLHRQPGLEVGLQVPRSFGHVNATQVEITVQRGAACSLGDPPYVVLQPFGGPEGDCCNGYSLTADHVLRAYVMGIGESIVVAMIDAPTQAEFDILLPKAEAVLDTLEFASP